MGFLADWWDAVRNMFGGGGQSYVSSSGGNRLYVGNLSYKVKDEELRALFAKYGKVRTLHLIRDRLTRRLKGYAFLEMAQEDAQKALALNGSEFLGRKIVVSIAKSKHRASPPARRQGRGDGGQGGPSPRWQRRRRSGPRVYGQKDQKDDTPLQRYE